MSFSISSTSLSAEQDVNKAFEEIMPKEINSLIVRLACSTLNDVANPIKGFQPLEYNCIEMYKLLKEQKEMLRLVDDKALGLNTRILKKKILDTVKKEILAINPKEIPFIPNKIISKLKKIALRVLNSKKGFNKKLLRLSSIRHPTYKLHSLVSVCTPKVAVFLKEFSPWKA